MKKVDFHFTRTIQGMPDGVNSVEYKEGETKSIPDWLARDFIQLNAGKLAKGAVTPPPAPPAEPSGSAEPGKVSEGAGEVQSPLETKPMDLDKLERKDLLALAKKHDLAVPANAKDTTIKAALKSFFKKSK